MLTLGTQRRSEEEVVVSEVTRLLGARAQLSEAEGEVTIRRHQLHLAITQAFDAGLTQSEIARATGYSRERVRQVLQQQQVPPPT